MGSKFYVPSSRWLFFLQLHVGAGREESFQNLSLSIQDLLRQVAESVAKEDRWGGWGDWVLLIRLKKGRGGLGNAAFLIYIRMRVWVCLVRLGGWVGGSGGGEEGGGGRRGGRGMGGGGRRGGGERDSLHAWVESWQLLCHALPWEGEEEEEEGFHFLCVESVVHVSFEQEELLGSASFASGFEREKRRVLHVCLFLEDVSRGRKNASFLLFLERFFFTHEKSFFIPQRFAVVHVLRFLLCSPAIFS